MNGDSMFSKHEVQLAAILASSITVIITICLIYSYNLEIMQTMMKEGYSQVLLPGSPNTYYQKHGTTNITRKPKDAE